MRIHQVHSLFQQRLAKATKPFNARGAKVVRCQYCQVATLHCICEHQPKVATKVAALIIMSDNEILKPSNTGRLIADTVEETYAFQWTRTEPDDALIRLLEDDQYQPVVVFPEDYVDEKSRLIDIEDPSVRHFHSDKTPLLIFLDGSWREARKMFRKSEYLSRLPVLSIRPETVSSYMMRKSDNETHLATAEVASMVLALFNEKQASETLSLWFDVFKESYLLSKTRIKPDLSKPMLTKYLECTANIEHRVAS
ncbi:putative DTW domain-containing protein [Vibrio nigripulchritudo SO65]|uniref:tRNA-uridine aminocarboxypropyltransferase n=1 Tax=Vibrio nigripulchritudo SOn1 TaxID=1238450 RepID=A0AAV2VP81_9VIBR|nr:tRNA-uridine aminocarboxypropyltransferase [Vibrio nigripulchritudo]CCN35270.1 putative DTW domain-containing protein [Vibrio nigripulchritudo AM115]CCN43261.1 putative DTW domain-containing protein [Vibrio nigripulchritudo FTn2]CCN63781.1 putative DTW domain-containing protein [Vibrio nigripulchritudo POn4]CCN77107.1 putative DTW domain-containing protein [Vibrio nigripulchritudo SO65]CCO46442.1 putative DTW domain-containing protein [Vibrio nigripulchritudo SOn1]